ncbi:nucleoside deaminase [Mycobacterium koreense]|uniref:tRNA-specific adenosine deaminase n=1 Tax=Mycolicibacillus koreensis TaxID=1069220 RepID=A0A7I7SAX2_9MYCO|nr:nucleoside deaminase [Mycolicibacillus koreensis]MCV7246998.1 nucleoside deaminase [Mycolicibacillus koreensis]OSC35029.1 tRNA-specific adenosine deaminase [Mycolicibacillus koreensis]BBY53531.1 tRNA-specific adenosine deaminase [Mycolicibacillus koreensis]
MALNDTDLQRLTRCVELAGEALDHGDEPFGAVLVGPDGEVLVEDRNRVGTGDPTAHPEFTVAAWAAANLAPVHRIRTSVYTSGEHCPMCAAAHAWVGLGRIVYATSAAQLAAWLDEWGVSAPPVAALPITTVVPRAVVDGPAPQFAEPMKLLYAARYRPTG